MALPLALNPLERLFLACDRKDYPTAFEFRLVFAQPLQQSVLEAAVTQLRPRHPLLFAQPKEGHWVACEHPRGDLWQLQDGGHQLALTFHHAHCDGLGAVFFMVDLLQAYHEAQGGEKRPWTPCDLSALPDRFLPKLPPSKPGQEQESGLWLRLKLALQYLTTGCCHLASPSGQQRWAFHAFTEEQSQAMQERARQAGASLSDWALASYLEALDAWPHRQGKGPLKILLPTDLRQSRHRKMGACNCLSFAFLTRTRAQCRAGKSQLLEELRQELRFIREFRPDYSTLWGLALLDRVGLLRPALRWLPSLQSSATFTFLGRFRSRHCPKSENGFWVGDSQLVEFQGYPPTHRGTPVALAVGEFEGRISLALSCDPEGPAAGLAQVLMSHLVEFF